MQHSQGTDVVSDRLERRREVDRHGDADARLAAAIGADVLAHAPVERLSAAAIDAWKGRAVIGTLAAFGASPDALDNLARLRAAGATVLYGTDFGNTRDAGISVMEIAAMLAAGLGGDAIVESATAAPARVWGLVDHGAIEVGRSASLLVLDADPREDPLTLARPLQVWIDGTRRDAG